jgi:hypothetical protein
VRGITISFHEIIFYILIAPACGEAVMIILKIQKMPKNILVGYFLKLSTGRAGVN